jgi:hypothetical protein
VPSLLIWWFWELSLNGAHFFATFSRTYLDRREWRERPALLLGSLLWIGLGPLTLMLDTDFDTTLASMLFYFFQLGWAYFHVVRQHYGILCLYQRKNQERSGRRNGAEYWLFNVAMFGPFVVWVLRYPPHRGMLHLPALAEADRVLIWLIQAIVLAAAVTYVVKAVADIRVRGRRGLPKAAFFVAYASLHCVTAMFLPGPYAFDLLLLNAVLTYPHNVQYMAIVWQYNRRRYNTAGGRHGAATFVSKSLPRFLLASAAFGVTFFYVSWYVQGSKMPFLTAMFSLARQPLYGDHSVGQFAGMIALGIILNHYYLDQKIWRVNRDADVAKNLGVPSGGGELRPEAVQGSAR